MNDIRLIIIVTACIAMIAAKTVYFLASWLFMKKRIDEKPGGGREMKKAALCGILCTLLSMLVDIVLLVWVLTADRGKAAIDYPLWENFLKTVEGWILIQYTANFAFMYLKQRKSVGNIGALGIVAIIIPIGQAMMIPFVSVKPEYCNYGYTAVLLLLAIAIDDVLLYTVYTMRGRELLKHDIYLREEQIRLQKLDNEMAVRNEQKLNELKKQYQEELDSIYDMYCNEEKPEVLNQKLDELEMQAQSTKAKAYCGNSIVNAIIYEKEQLCIEKGIHFEADMCLAEKTGISDLNLCSIFTNMLNNAIRECIAPGGSYVKVLSGYHGDYLNISVVNSIADAKRVQKKLKNAHGHGLKILQDIAGRYNGRFHTNISKNEFRADLSVMINSYTAEKQNDAGAEALM